MGPLCLFWIFRKTRNKITFEGDELSIQSPKKFFPLFVMVRNKACIKDYLHQNSKDRKSRHRNFYLYDIPT